MSAQTPAITFYDVDSTLWPETWSPFNARTLLTLNHLNIAYTRHQTSYPDIAPVLTPLNVTPPPNPTYTTPAVTFDNQKTIMGSTEIAQHLSTLNKGYAEKLFPLGDSPVEEMNKQWKAINLTNGFVYHIIPFVPDFLDPRGVVYFHETRAPKMGDLNELKKKALEEEKEKSLKIRVKEALEPVVQVYKEFDGEGSGEAGVFLGRRKEPSYADFMLVGLIRWWICARGDEIMEGVKEILDGRFAEVYKGCEGLLRPRFGSDGRLIEGKL